jgi:DNA-directed RNA polymerase II subunit RPB7
MGKEKLNNIFYDTTLYKRIVINPDNINKDLNETLKNILITDVEGKCVREGYIEENSINIIKRSVPYFYGNQLNGSMAIDIIYSAKICCPIKGNIIECDVQKINKLGILASTGPLSIIIARQFHKNKNIFKDIKENEKISIKVIDKRFNINEKKISIIAELYNNNNTKSLISELSDTKSIDTDSNIASDEYSEVESSDEESLDIESSSEESSGEESSGEESSKYIDDLTNLSSDDDSENDESLVEKDKKIDNEKLHSLSEDNASESSESDDSDIVE